MLHCKLHKKHARPTRNYLPWQYYSLFGFAAMPAVYQKMKCATWTAKGCSSRQQWPESSTRHWCNTPRLQTWSWCFGCPRRVSPHSQCRPYEALLLPSTRRTLCPRTTCTGHRGVQSVAFPYVSGASWPHCTDLHDGFRRTTKSRAKRRVKLIANTTDGG